MADWRRAEGVRVWGWPRRRAAMAPSMQQGRSARHTKIARIMIGGSRRAEELNWAAIERTQYTTNRSLHRD